MDKYPNFSVLRAAETEGQDFSIIVQRREGSGVAILAPHGGKIERGTTEVARATAGEAYNLYLFEGRKADANRDLHITSTNFDEPQAIGLVQSCDQVLAVHGLAGDGEDIEVGGRDTDLRGRIDALLTAEGFASRVVTKGPYAATSPSNICNRGRTGAGAQIEIRRGLRDRLCDDPPLLVKFTRAIRQAIEDQRTAV